MSMLTKVLAVLLVAMSIFFSAVAISFVSMSRQWQEEAATLQRKLTEETTRAKHLVTSWQTQAADQLRMTADRTREIETLKSQINGLQNERTQMMAQLSEQRTQVATLQGNLTRQSETNRDLSQRYDLLSDRNRRAEDELSQLQRVNHDLITTLRKVRSDLRTLEDKNRQLREQNAAQRQENAALRSEARQMAQAGRTAAGVPEMLPEGVSVRTSFQPSRIEGRITEVDGNLAAISVGATSGVRKGQRFIVYRDGGSGDGAYVGMLTVEMVKDSQAVGLLSLSPGQTASKDDRVADRLE